MRVLWDSISIDMNTKKYYYDLQADELEQAAVEDGFLLFFQKDFKTKLIIAAGGRYEDRKCNKLCETYICG